MIDSLKFLILSVRHTHGLAVCCRRVKEMEEKEAVTKQSIWEFQRFGLKKGLVQVYHQA